MPEDVEKLKREAKQYDDDFQREIESIKKENERKIANMRKEHERQMEAKKNLIAGKEEAKTKLRKEKIAPWKETAALETAEKGKIADDIQVSCWHFDSAVPVLSLTSFLGIQAIERLA